MKQLMECIGISYQESSSITCQGNRMSIQPDINKGYYVKSENYGNWVLYRPTRVIATLKGPNLIECNIKDYITSYYGKSRISYKQYEDFCKLVACGKISFFMDEYGNCTIE